MRTIAFVLAAFVASGPRHRTKLVGLHRDFTPPVPRCSRVDGRGGGD
jgi:hypothetical protein